MLIPLPCFLNPTSHSSKLAYTSSGTWHGSTLNVLSSHVDPHSDSVRCSCRCETTWVVTKKYRHFTIIVPSSITKYLILRNVRLLELLPLLRDEIAQYGGELQQFFCFPRWCPLKLHHACLAWGFSRDSVSFVYLIAGHETLFGSLWLSASRRTCRFFDLDVLHWGHVCRRLTSMSDYFSTLEMRNCWIEKSYILPFNPPSIIKKLWCFWFQKKLTTNIPHMVMLTVAGCKLQRVAYVRSLKWSNPM